MAKSESPKLPTTPSLYVDPDVGLAKKDLMSKGQALTSDTVNGLPDILRPTVETNPEVTRLTLEGLRATLDPELRRSRQDVINQLEANNQLTGSTTANALTNLQSDYESRLVAAGAEAGLADINRAFQNRVGLYANGLNAIQSAGSLGVSNQSQINQFNLDNYSNQVAKVMAEQKQNRGGLTGALTGGAGGLMAGLALAPFTGGASLALTGGLAGAGALAGGLGQPGTGGAFLQAGAMGLGSKLPTTGTTSSNSSSVYSPWGESINKTLNDFDPLSFYKNAGIGGSLR